MIRATILATLLYVIGSAQIFAADANDFLFDGTAVTQPSGMSKLCQSSFSNIALKTVCSKYLSSDAPLKHDVFIVQYINKRLNMEKTYASDISLNHETDKWLNPENESSVDCEEYAIAKQQSLMRQKFQRSSLRLTLVMDEKRRFSIVLTYRGPDADYILDYRNNDLLKWNETGYFFVARQSSDDPQLWHSLNWVKGGTTSNAKDILKRPNGREWTSCVDINTELPSEVMQATTAPPEEVAELIAPSPQEFKTAAQSFHPKWPGYKPVTKITDKAVVDWSKHIFRIYSFGARSKGELPTVVDLYNAKKTIKGNMKIDRSDREFQIQACKSQKLKRCPIFAHLTAGTAFKIGKDTYYTCRHNVDTWLTWASELNGVPLSSISPPLALTDERKGKISKVLFYSAQPRNQKYHAKLFNPEPKLKADREDNFILYNTESFFKRAADIVVFGLTSANTGIEPADQIEFAALKPGEGLFLIGYPGKFKLFPKGEGDSNGDRLYASHGTYVGETPFPGDHGKIAEFSNFGFPGNSGGPLVREDGKLVGMICYADDTSRTHENAHTYVTTTNASSIESWWKNLPPPPEPKFKLPDGYAN